MWKKKNLSSNANDDNDDKANSLQSLRQILFVLLTQEFNKLSVHRLKLHEIVKYISEIRCLNLQKVFSTATATAVHRLIG